MAMAMAMERFKKSDAENDKEQQMNVFTCTARLGADAEQRFTASGESVVSFNGAVDSGFGDKKVTTWIKFILWGKRGASVAPFLKKGGKVICTGELTNRKWTDKEGNDRYSLELNVNTLDLDSKRQEEPESNYPARSEKQSSVKSGDLESDIPF